MSEVAYRKVSHGAPAPDFIAKLAHAVQLKEFAIEYGCNVPVDAIGTINELSTRCGISGLDGGEVSEAFTPVTAEDITALDIAVMALNAAACPTTLSLFSRPSESQLFEYFRRGVPRQLEYEKFGRVRERFYWVIIIAILFDTFAFQEMSTWTAPLILGILEVGAVAVLSRKYLHEAWSSMRRASEAGRGG